MVCSEKAQAGCFGHCCRSPSFDGLNCSTTPAKSPFVLRFNRKVLRDKLFKLASRRHGRSVGRITHPGYGTGATWFAQPIARIQLP
jgi:hypothetical protein